MRRTVTNQERRARLGRRHLLAEPEKTPSGVVDALVALHSSDPATVYLTAWARARPFDVEDLEGCLYEERSLVRFYGMRRTLWVVDAADLPVVHSSSTRSVAERSRRRGAKILEDAGVTEDGQAWMDRVGPEVLDVIAGEGEILTRDLTKQIPALAEKVTFRNRAGKVIGSSGLTSRILTQLALESKIVRTRPTGSWISGQYRWARTEDWLGGPIAQVPKGAASADLVRRWLLAFGPGTLLDLRWWTGWNVGQVRAALAAVGAVEVDLEEGAIGYLLPDDLDPVPEPDPWIALLPSLDPTSMGWKERDWYLGGHAPLLFDRNGNSGPTVWVNGEIVGGWSQLESGEVVTELLRDVGREEQSMIQDRAGILERWLAPVTVTPRFRSPLDKALWKGQVT